jgi:hypothetical protein
MVAHNARLWRLRMHNDLEKHFHLDPPILTDEEVQQSKDCRELPPLAERAVEVDWYRGVTAFHATSAPIVIRRCTS